MPNRTILSMFPRGFLSDEEQSYELRLTIGGADKHTEENDCAVCFTAYVERENDEEAIKVAKRIAQRIGCELDLELIGGGYFWYKKDSHVQIKREDG